MRPSPFLLRAAAVLAVLVDASAARMYWGTTGRMHWGLTSKPFCGTTTRPSWGTTTKINPLDGGRTRSVESSEDKASEGDGTER